MKLATYATLEAARTVRLDLAALLPAPVQGIHVGRGPWVAMPDAWDGAGDVPPGWTGHPGERETEDGAELPLPDDLTSASVAASKLPAVAKARLSAALRDAKGPTEPLAVVERA